MEVRAMKLLLSGPIFCPVWPCYREIILAIVLLGGAAFVAYKLGFNQGRNTRK
jgi:hypothetical protein